MQTKIRELLKESMKAKDEVALGVYRALLTGFMNELVAKGRTPQDALTDEECMTVIRRAIKQREDAIKQFTDGGRPELADKEESEKKVLLQFLPAQLTEAEVESRVREILQDKQPLDPKNIGKYTGMCVSQLKDVTGGEIIKKVVEKVVAER